MTPEETRVVAEHLPNVLKASTVQVDGTLGLALRRAVGRTASWLATC